MLKTVNVSSLVANPFRELDDYPIDRDKVDALNESIEATGFWGTIVARKKGSKYEIAFGHHRMMAMKELKLKRCDIIVRDLSNEDMVQMMARENLEEWGTSAYIEAQTVESTIRAYGNGEIELPVPSDTPKNLYRYSGKGVEHPYTVQSVAEFLGWTKAGGGKGTQPNHACRVAFEMLDALEAKVVTRKQLRGVKRDVAREIVTKAMTLKREQEKVAKVREKQAEEAERLAEEQTDAKKQRAFKSAAARKRAEAKVAEESAQSVAKEFAADAVKQTKSGNWSQRDVREAAAKEKARLHSKAEQRYKKATQHYDSLSRKISGMLNEMTDKEFKSLVSMLSLDCGLEAEDIKAMQDEVSALIKRAEQFKKKLHAWKQPKQANAVESQLRIVG